MNDKVEVKFRGINRIDAYIPYEYVRNSEIFRGNAILLSDEVLGCNAVVEGDTLKIDCSIDND